MITREGRQLPMVSVNTGASNNNNNVFFPAEDYMMDNAEGDVEGEGSIGKFSPAKVISRR